MICSEGLKKAWGIGASMKGRIAKYDLALGSLAFCLVGVDHLVKILQRQIAL